MQSEARLEVPERSVRERAAQQADMTAGELIVDLLCEWGVKVVFGLPGDGINGVFEGLRKRKDDIRFVHVRHEEAAAFMACGYAKYTGQLGVCITTSGPGGIHLLNGLYDAKLDGVPVLAITGMGFHDLVSTHSQQDIELDKLFQDVCVYNARVMGPAHVENVMELACRTALAYRGVAHVTIPVDFQSQKVARKERSARNVPNHVSNLFADTPALPNQAALAQAAEILSKGRKVVILAGRGSIEATDELLEVAELLGAPIVKPLLGKAAVPDDSIYTTGGIGLLGTRPSQEAIENCDTLLMVGTSFPYLEFMPGPGQARAVQIDLNPARIGLRYPVESGLVADSKLALRALIPLLKRNDDRAFLTEAQKGMREWWDLMRERGTRTDHPMKPQVVAWELGRRLPENAIISCDSGTVATWWARQIPSKRGQKHSISGNLATMACGLSYAMAAQVAYPDRKCIAFIGDGAASMLMGEFATCVQNQLPVKIVVIRNNTLGMIKWEQMVMLGNPEFGCELSPIDFAAVARACGLKAIRLEEASQAPAAMDELLSSDGPCLLEALVDPFEPPLPAKITPKQALQFGRSMLRGEPFREKIAMTILADKVRELI